MLLTLLTMAGQPPAEAAHPQAATSKTSRSTTSKQVKKKPSTARRSPSRRRVARQRTSRRLARMNAEILQASRAAIARDDLRGEDMDVRAAALSALGDLAGSVVVMDPQSGRIHSIVNQEWALGKPCSPCSTIKPYIALAGLKERLIDTNVPVAPGGALSISLINALAYSDNTYFQRIGVQLGLDKIRQYAEAFGLGQLTGINMLGETSGRLPQASDFKGTISYAASHGEGFEVTPLQLAVFTAALANGGAVYKPFVVPRDQAEPSNGTEGNGGGESEPAPVLVNPAREISMTQDQRINILAGMIGAVEFGTARQAIHPDIQVAGKTGTCRGDDVLRWGLFTSFSKLERPSVVVVVVTHGIGQSGSTASQVAGKIYGQLADRFNLRRPGGWSVVGGQ
jgi:cell division protein FtsI/penicillin-binding protein 2